MYNHSHGNLPTQVFETQAGKEEIQNKVKNQGILCILHCKNEMCVFSILSHGILASRYDGFCTNPLKGQFFFLKSRILIKTRFRENLFCIVLSNFGSIRTFRGLHLIFLFICCRSRKANVKGIKKSHLRFMLQEPQSEIITF